jgi:hypothetical protein
MKVTKKVKSMQSFHQPIQKAMQVGCTINMAILIILSFSQAFKVYTFENPFLQSKQENDDKPSRHQLLETV